MYICTEHAVFFECIHRTRVCADTHVCMFLCIRLHANYNDATKACMHACVYVYAFVHNSSATKACMFTYVFVHVYMCI